MRILKHPWLILAVSMLVTFIIKVPHLGFPLFNDETFSYYPAIHEMAKVGPSMMPGSIPMILSKGHPLFFYFVSSLWVKYIAGDSLLLIHLFALFVALFSLWAFHRFARRHTNLFLANAAVALLSVQTLFLGQASLILPEIFLFALFVLAFDSFLSEQYRLYALMGSLMMLTKETAAVFIMVFGLGYFIEHIKLIKTRKFWIEICWLGVPVLMYGIFLLLHYAAFKEFFFSEHLGYITLQPDEVLRKFSSASSTLFLKHGRNLIFYAGLVALLVLFLRKKSIEFKRFLIYGLIILISYLIFTILNFYIYRYILPVMGLLFLMCLALLWQVRSQKPVVNFLYIMCAVFVCSYYTATKRGQSDADLGYIQFLKVHKEVVKYCESQAWYDKEFGSGYNVVMAMRDNFSGYLSSEKNFHMHHLPGIKDRDFIIYDSTCWPYEMPDEEKKHLVLVKRFVYKKHWAEIYRVSKDQ